MTEEDQRAYTQNCYDGLNSLNKLIDSLLVDKANDEELKATKEQIEESMLGLEKSLEGLDGNKK